jgi:ABC-2 type transport system permease protein
MRDVLREGMVPFAHLAWAGGLNVALLVMTIILFYKTFAYCKVQGSLVRVGE